MPDIPLHRPDLSEADLDGLLSPLLTGWLVQGPQVAAFEAQVAAWTGRKHAVAVSSGTTALTLGLRALGFKAGDEVLVPAMSWPSPAHAVAEMGGQVRAVEVHETRWNSEAEHFAAARRSQTRFAIAIPQFGNPVDVDAIREALPGVRVLVDAACALGAEWQGQAMASYGEVATLSFHPRKVLTTGEGGALLCDDDQIAAQLRTLRNHGLDAQGHFQVAAGNGRLSELAAALGLQQFPRLEAVLKARRLQWQRYRQALPQSAWQAALPEAAPNAQTVGVCSRTEQAREALITEAGRRGIGIGRLSYHLPSLASLAAHLSPTDAPVAKHIAACGLSLPCYAGLSACDQDRVIDLLSTELR